MHQFLLGALLYMDRSQYRAIAHVSLFARNIVMQLRQESSGSHILAQQRETVFEAVERAARQSRATMLAQHSAILAQFPTIREIALTWAYLCDDVDSLRAAHLDSCDIGIIKKLHNIMINVPYNEVDVDGALACTIIRRSGLSTRATIDNIIQCFAPRCMQYINSPIDASDPILAQISSNGELIYVRNDARIVDIICDIFGVEALQQYITDHESVTMCRTNLCERSYALRAILRADTKRTLTRWVADTVRVMKLVPTSVANAQVIADILCLLGDHETVISLLSDYFTSTLFSPELLDIMARVDNKASRASLIDNMLKQINMRVESYMNCTSIGILTQWISYHKHSMLHNTITRVYSLTRDNASVCTTLAYIHTDVLAKSDEYMRIARNVHANGTILRVCEYMVKHMKPTVFSTVGPKFTQSSHMIAQLVNLAFIGSDPSDHDSDRDSDSDHDRDGFDRFPNDTDGLRELLLSGYASMRDMV